MNRNIITMMQFDKSHLFLKSFEKIDENKIIKIFDKSIIIEKFANFKERFKSLILDLELIVGAKINNINVILDENNLVDYTLRYEKIEIKNYGKKIITKEYIRNILEKTNKVMSANTKHKLINTIPIKYSYIKDNTKIEVNNVHSIIGLNVDYLIVSIAVYEISKTLYEKLSQTIKSVGCQLDMVSLETSAFNYEVLSTESRYKNHLVLNINKKTTISYSMNLISIKNRKINIGIVDVLSKIANDLKVSKNKAYELLLLHTDLDWFMKLKKDFMIDYSFNNEKYLVNKTISTYFKHIFIELLKYMKEIKLDLDSSKILIISPLNEIKGFEEFLESFCKQHNRIKNISIYKRLNYSTKDMSDISYIGFIKLREQLYNLIFDNDKLSLVNTNPKNIKTWIKENLNKKQKRKYIKK